MSCANCTTAATSWIWGGTTTGCHGCLVRMLARMPQHLRREGYGTYLQEHQDMAKVRALQAEVKAEHERIQVLRGQQQEGRTC